MSKPLISHALDTPSDRPEPLELKKHIEQVIKASETLISQKSLNFNGLTKDQIKEICILIAACHDFGKSTIFFQDYIQSKIDDSPYRGNKEDKSHSLISGLFGWYMLEKKLAKNEQVEERWKSFLPFAVLVAIEGHHGYYTSIEEILKKVADGTCSGLLSRQLLNIQQEIFTYEFDGFHLKHGSDFNLEIIKQIWKRLRKIHRKYKKKPINNQIEHRILGLLLYSILLEADKAYLASDNPEQYEREPIDIPGDIVDKYVESLNSDATINKERKKAYTSTIRAVEDFPLEERVHSITLPTGLGKTLLAASWAIKLRSRLKKKGVSSRIIVSLPFLSIIEQTDDVYKRFLDKLYRKRADRLYSTSYSIADFKYRDGIDKEERSDNSIDFFMSIWNSELIVTTFDQLLYSIFSLKSKNLMRFHNLFNSILVFDEIQALPSDLWKPFEFFFKKFTEVGDSHIILMSATQPGFFPSANERVPEHQKYFKDRKRVKLNIQPGKISIGEFVKDLLPKLDEYFDKSVMVVLNTKPSSKIIYKAVKNAMDEGSIKKRPLVYLSSYVAPIQRIQRVKRINKYLTRFRKRFSNPVVITTQCIEAGVDIDMDYVIRDWAPLDSIFQVCGRCNRNGEKEKGIIDIIHLVSENSKVYSSQVYDDILLECTAVSLNNSTKISESQFYDYGTYYFNAVRERLGQSMRIVQAFAGYSHKYEKEGKEKVVNIKELLRGEQWQEQFIVPSLDLELPEEIKKALKIDDRWKRRFAIKRLGRRIAETSVNVRFEGWMPNRPDVLANNQIDNFLILDEQYYDKKGVGFNADIYKKIGGTKLF